MIKFLDLQKQYLGIKQEMDAAIAAVIAESAFIGGKYVREFEIEFAAYQSAEHCVSVANGTDALEIVFEALNLPPGSEVIVPANSFIASSESVTRSGYRVVFADVDPATYTLDPADVRRRITPRTKAILAVHLYGRPCEMDELLEIARESGLHLIEDAAQAHGAEYKGRRVGTFGVASTFSFYPGKNLGAYGDAGAILTNDAQLALKCRMIANHGRTKKYEHEFEGRNSRMDGLQGAVLQVKLRHLDGWVDTRNRLARKYLQELSGVEGVVVPTLPENGRHAFHLFVIRTSRREELAAYLKEQGIETGVHYPVSLPKLAAYQYLDQAGEDMVSNRFDAEVLSLPLGEHLEESDIVAVASAIKAFVSQPAARA
ncbi:MAG TPA: DegT/DnrJ/EryC1/StrS family aminotransferase [Thermoanaerobaculia bacterium]|jgi:dTDP-4-amino-4,6-dideoxygalactose transaminase